MFHRNLDLDVLLCKAFYERRQDWIMEVVPPLLVNGACVHAAGKILLRDIPCWSRGRSGRGILRWFNAARKHQQHKAEEGDGGWSSLRCHRLVTGDACAPARCCAATTSVRWVSIAVSTFMPTRSSLASGWSGRTRIFTLRRCTILVKFPVAFSGGIAEKVAPEAGAMPSTTPLISRLYASR